MRRSAATLLALALSASAASAQTFDFETTPSFTTVPFSVTSGGLTATFTSAANFMVQPSPFVTLAGRVLMDNDATVSPLTIMFSTPLTGISLRFGTNAPLSTTGLTLQARNGATVVGTVSGPGAVPGGALFPEGTLSFSGAAFNTVVLSSTAPDFAVDNIVVTSSAAVIPEPSTVTLVGTGVLVLAGAAARRRRTST